MNMLASSSLKMNKTCTTYYYDCLNQQSSMPGMIDLHHHLLDTSTVHSDAVGE
jgi:hypothetical protein